MRIGMHKQVNHSYIQKRIQHIRPPKVHQDNYHLQIAFAYSRGSQSKCCSVGSTPTSQHTSLCKLTIKSQFYYVEWMETISILLLQKLSKLSSKSYKTLYVIISLLDKQQRVNDAVTCSSPSKSLQNVQQESHSGCTCGLCQLCEYGGVYQVLT